MKKNKAILFFFETKINAITYSYHSVGIWKNKEMNHLMQLVIITVFLFTKCSHIAEYF